MSKRSKFPEGWDDARVKRVLEHYESQTEEQAVAEDEAAAEQKNQTLMEVPSDLVPAVRDLIAKNRRAS
jgi:type II secretory pathway component PulC